MGRDSGRIALLLVDVKHALLGCSEQRRSLDLLVAADELEGELKMQPGEGEMLDRDGDQVRRDKALSEAFW